MGHDQFVEFIEQRESRVMVPVLDRFKFMPRARWAGWRGRGHVWLQQKAWAFLGWSGALQNPMSEVTSYTRHRIDTRDVMERLLKQRSALFRAHRNPKELLIGSEDFAELMGHPKVYQEWGFNAMTTVMTCEPDERPRKTLFGLHVRVIPWMQGMVVMP